MIFTANEIAYLASQPLGRIATQQPDGTLQVSPVAFRFTEATDTIDISGHNMESSLKFRNVADNARVAFVVDDLASTNPWRPRFIEIRGWAEAITAERGAALPFGSRGAFISIHPERVLAWGLDAPAQDSPRLNGMPYNARDIVPRTQRHITRQENR